MPKAHRCSSNTREHINTTQCGDVLCDHVWQNDTHSSATHLYTDISRWERDQHTHAEHVISTAGQTHTHTDGQIWDTHTQDHTHTHTHTDGQIWDYRSCEILHKITNTHTHTHTHTHTQLKNRCLCWGLLLLSTYNHNHIQLLINITPHPAFHLTQKYSTLWS